MREIEKRIFMDRRKEPTPGLSRYIFFGRRKDFRRKIDHQRGGYVDQYSPGLFFFLISIISLNILDALLTMMILDLKGCEINPIVCSVMTLYGDHFWIWKFAIVSVSLLLLCLHSRFSRVKTIVVSISFIYFAVVLYQIFLIIYQ